MSDLENYSRAQQARHPAPADNSISRLEHVIQAFGLTPESQRAGHAVMATSGLYGPMVETGLRYSDLPVLLGIIRDQAARIAQLESGENPAAT